MHNEKILGLYYSPDIRGIQSAIICQTPITQHGREKLRMLKGGDHLEDLVIDGRVIYNYIKEYGVTVYKELG